MFFCAISGEPPQEPVVSKKSGRVFERRLITKYITENGTDPTSGEPLEEADLVPIVASPDSAPPRPPNHASIPSLLQTLQNEWDALVLETYTLRQQYNNSRQELSHALYSQDAATRVAARLLKERNAAREALANVQASMGISAPAAASEDVEMAEDAGEGTITKTVLDRIDETYQTLSAARKKRKAPADYTTAAEIKTFASKHTIPSLHSPSPSGITSLALSTANSSQFLTGGNDKVVQFYDRDTDKVLAGLKGHTKKVNHVALRERQGEPTLFLSAGADKIAKVWSRDEASEEYIPKYTIRSHKGELTGLAVHPTSTLAALCSSDKTYSIQDLTSFSQVFRSAPGEDAYTSMAVHPDGTLLALGTSTSSIQIFDVRTGALAASLQPQNAPPFTVNTLSFSENGYHLLAPDSLSSAAIWDLRKQKTAHSISLGDGFKINKVLYDLSAQFLAVAGSEGARIYAHKSWDELVRFEEGGEVTDIAFGAQSKEIWGITGREVRIWGAPA